MFIANIEPSARCARRTAKGIRCKAYGIW